MCQRLQAIQDRIKALAYCTRVARVLVDADGNEKEDTPRHDTILDFNESSEKVRRELAKFEQFIAAGGMHAPNESNAYRERAKIKVKASKPVET
jgi:hypothetical protein